MLAACAPAADQLLLDVAPFGEPPVVDAEPSLTPGAAITLHPVPPISGGTLLALSDNFTIVAADPDDDMLFAYNTSLLSQTLDHARDVVSLPLRPGDQPGRMTEDSWHLVHVILRGAGEIADVQVAPTLRLLSRRHVCADPRGIAYDAPNDTLVVACAGGDLMRMLARGGAAELLLHLPYDDLRDIVISDAVYVSRFRAAEVLILDSWTLSKRVPMPERVFNDGHTSRAFEPAVAWRMTSAPGGGVLVVHQIGQRDPIPLSLPFQAPDAGMDAGMVMMEPPAGVYGSATPAIGCVPSGIMHGALTTVDVMGHVGMVAGLLGSLPVDVVDAPSGIGVVSAGAGGVVQITSTFPSPCENPSTPVAVGSPVAIAVVGTKHVVQVRSPAGLVVSGIWVPFPVHQRDDLGHALFHHETPAALACASCHPEGRDDGRVWNFLPDGPRRTQNLSGGVLSTAPFHWDGALANLDAIVDEVFVRRMGATAPSPKIRAALGAWLNSLPAQTSEVDGDVARGKRIFEDPAVGCASCHLGPHLTSNLTVDVGTGGAFQVPSLRGVGSRAPYLHDGCAATLEERFGNCGGGDQHGATSQLSAEELDALIAYLKSL